MTTLVGYFLSFEFLSTSILILTAIYVYFKYHVYQYWKKKGVFNPEPLFPTGNVLKFFIGTNSLANIYCTTYKKYKDEHRFVGLYAFHKPQLIITDPEVIKFIMAKEFASFHDRGLYSNEKVDPLSGHLFLLSGQKWRNLRVKLTPTFTTGKIKQMFGMVQQIGTELTAHLDNHISTNSNVEIDIKDVLARFSTDVIMSTAFGVNCDSLKNPNSEFRYWGKKAFEPNRLTRSASIIIPKLLKSFSISIMDKGLTDFFINTFRETVNYRKDNNVTRHDFLDLLIQLMDKGYVAPDEDKSSDSHNDNGHHGKLEKLSMLEGAAQAFVFILAGFETSSTTATFALYELALNQNIQDKLREEIEQVLKKHHNQLTYDCLMEMHYLHQVVSETLRKYPPVPVLIRTCTKEVTLPETKVRLSVGNTIIIPVLGIQRDPDIYPDPEKFDPERFTPDNAASRHPFVYLPFGEGPRICIGMRFGLMQTKVALVSALSKFKVKLAKNMPRSLEFDAGSIVLSAKGGIHLQIERK